ncbi:MAG: ABC transporter substrate-binding protein [Candidatus Rokubacteria bacterium]|nr:ABC transporter substrate-binding protein [Candidatus Rokubacteria bacterium]
MSQRDPSRRDLLRLGAAGAVAVAAAARFTDVAWAQKSLVATSYPGNWEEAHRKVLVPAFEKRTGARVTLTPILAVEQVAKIKASPKNPPFDAVIFDEGPNLVAVKEGLLEAYPTAKSPAYAKLHPLFQSREGSGPSVTIQPIGIAYNPAKIKRPPTSWADLFKPEYKGLVGLTTMVSSLGTAFVVEIAKLFGGSEANAEPAFRELKKLLPNVAAIAPSPGALATMFQQGEIAIAPHYYINISLLIDKGVPVDWVAPKEGIVGIRTYMNVVKNSDVDLATAYIDTALSAPVQSELAAKPYYMIPTSRDARIAPEVGKRVPATPEGVQKMVFNNWAKINESRAAWIERWNKEMRA